MAFAAAASAAIASLFAANAAREVELDIYRQEQEAMSLARLIDPAQRREHTLHPGDCQSCGSQEFRMWRGVSVCAYCRSVAQATAAPARHTPVFNEYKAALAADISVRHGLWADIKRHHALARITTE